MRRVLAALAAVLVVLLPAAPAWAHNQLVEAVPAREAKLAAGPTEVKLRFLERLNPEFTTIVVSDAAKQRVPSADPVVDGVSGTVALNAAPGEGVYTVAYRTVSVDGHTVQGSYTFTVGDPPPPASAAPEAVASGNDADGNMMPLLIGGAAVLVAAAGVLLWWLRRRRPAPA